MIATVSTPVSRPIPAPIFHHPSPFPILPLPQASAFAAFGLRVPILRAVAAEGYTTPTPIQVQAIPHVMQGRDLLGCAQTGTGKTAAFALPLLHRMSDPAQAKRRGPRVLVLAPTRELAVQIADSFRVYGKYVSLNYGVILGGVSQGTQVATLRRGVDVLVATPGRLLDLMSQGCVPLADVETLVLDEADRMLDMGFIDPIRRIIAKLPAKRQNLLFSATMPSAIATLAGQILRDPAKVSVAPAATTVDTVSQAVYFVRQSDKRTLLREVLRDPALTRAIVFTRTKAGANRVARDLTAAGVSADAIHGNKSQNARQNALAAFRNGKVRVLVATDIAARGLDIDGIHTVINYEVPDSPDAYVHRVGRTGRADEVGQALTLVAPEERSALALLEKSVGVRLEWNERHD